VSRGGRILAACVVVGAAVALAFVLRDRGRTDEIRRPAVRLPDPLPEEKARFFYMLMRSGKQVELMGASVPVWRTVGEPAFVMLGKTALDFLLSPERDEEYRRTPNMLLNVLRLLPLMPAAADHPRLYPFLNHWLDPDNLPPKTPRADIATDVRPLAFAVMRTFPDPAAVPAALEELTREERVHDLRNAAIWLLLRAGEGARLLELYDSLPPNEDEPEGTHRAGLMLQLYRLIGPGASADAVAQMRALEPILLRAARSVDTAERQNAIGALYRLGDERMAERLIAEYQRAAPAGDDRGAWNALDLLAKDKPHPFVRAEAWRRLREPEGSPLSYQLAITLLGRWHLDEPEAAERLWSEVEGGSGRVSPYALLPRLMRRDRARAVRWLSGQLDESDWAGTEAAVRFIKRRRVTELGATLMELARNVEPEQRPLLYDALVELGTPGVEALLIAELSGAADRVVHGAAITELLNLGGPRGIERLAEALEDGDRALLRALLGRAQVSASVPEPLVPGILNALRTWPSEEERRVALFVLRYCGTLEGIRDELMDAYRREPSRRVAMEIREVMEELAHR